MTTSSGPQPVNPFIPGIWAPEWTVGRNALLECINDAVRHGWLGVVIGGPRGIGKTALVDLYGLTYGQTIRVIHVDVRDYLPPESVRNDAAVRQWIARGIVEELSFSGFLPPSVDPEHVSEDGLFRELLPIVCGSDARRLVVILDELDLVDPGIVRRVWRSFFRMRKRANRPVFVGILGETWNASEVHPLDESDERFAFIPVGPLVTKDIGALVQLFEERGLGAWQRDAADAIWDETRGYPLFVASLMYQLHEYRHRSAITEPVTADEIHTVARIAEPDMPDRVRHALSQAGPAAQRVLVTLAGRGALSVEELVAIVVAEWKCTEEEIRVSLQGLGRAFVVDQHDGVVTIPIPLLRGWLNALAPESIEMAERPPAPDTFEVFRRGEALFTEGRLDEAMVQLREAVALDPSYWRARWFLARALFERSRHVETSSDDLAEAERLLSDLRSEVPWRGGIQQQVEQLLCHVLVRRITSLELGSQLRRGLCDSLRGLDPELQTPGALEPVAEEEVEVWARELRQIPPERWLTPTREALRHERRWPGVSQRLERWLREALEPGGDLRHGAHLVRGVLGPLLEVEPPEGTKPAFWDPLIRMLQVVGRESGQETEGFPALLLEAALRSVPQSRHDALLKATVGLIQRGLRRALVGGNGREAVLLVHVLREAGAMQALVEILPSVNDVVLAAVDDAATRSALLESLGAFLLATSADGAPERLVADARDTARLFFETFEGTLAGTPIVLGEAEATGWSEYIRENCEGDAKAATFVRRLRPVVPQRIAVADMSVSERETVSAYLGGDYEVLSRQLLRVRGLWDPIVEDSVRAYRAVRRDADQEYLVRVFHIRTDSEDLVRVLRSIWENERRALSALSLNPSGRALTRYEDERFHSGAAVLITEWPGTVTLRDRLEGTRTGLFEPGRRAQLWGHMAALLEGVEALHRAGFIHRALRPEVIYVTETCEDSEPRLRPALKVGHFEWSVYVRGLSQMASSAHRRLNRYIAPEALRAALGVPRVASFDISRAATGETFSSDLYSLGLLLFEVCVRPLSEQELGYYRVATSYDEVEETAHRKWIADLRQEVLDRTQNSLPRPSEMLDPRERRVLHALLEFDLVARPKNLEQIIQLAQSLARADTEPAWLSAGGKPTVVTTLSCQTGYDDPREDPRCIAFFLRKLLPPAELDGKRLSETLDRELRGATIHLNSNRRLARRGGASDSGREEAAPIEYPLLLRSRSGVLFRIREFDWSIGGAGPKVKQPWFAFLEVARLGDRIVEGGELGTLKAGLAILDVDRSNVVDQQLRSFRHGSDPSWEPLFGTAKRLRAPIDTARQQRRQGLADTLSVGVEVEYQAFNNEVHYERVSEGRSLIRAQEGGINLAEVLARWAADELVFELSFPRSLPGRGRSFVLEHEMLDLETGTVDVKLTSFPDRGIIRPAGLNGTDLQYRRRRRVLRQVVDDDYLLDAIVDPGAVTRQKELTSAPAMVLGDLDKDKHEITRTFLEIGPLLVVQGPPGTGKTTLAAEIILQTLKRSPNARILVTTQSHEPLDNLLERIVTEGSQNQTAARLRGDAEIVRIPSGWRERGATVAAGFYPHVRAETLFQQMKAWSTRERHTLGLQGEVARRLAGQLSLYESAPDSLRRRIRDGANLVFATTNSSHLEAERPGSYDLVILEEAARCYPIEAMGAMRLARRWVLIGDEQQLEPYGSTQILRAFEQFAAERTKEIDQSEMDEDVKARDRDRLVELQKGFHTYRLLFRHLRSTDGRHRAALETQWRMHPRIGEMVSSVFYDGKKVLNPDGHRLAALAARKTHLLTAPEWLKGEQIVWIDFDPAGSRAEFAEARTSGGRIDNQPERRTLIAILRDIRSPRLTRDLAILTPYRAQAEQIHNMLDAEVNDFKAFGVIPDRVFTVDSFQGRQAGIVFVSLVRNNLETDVRRAIGFLAEKERATVMFSRAERLLVVLGCSAHFSRFEDQGAKWIMDIRRRSHIVHADELLPPEEQAKLHARGDRGRHG